MTIGLCNCYGNDEAAGGGVMLAQTGVMLPLVFSQKVAGLIMRKTASA